jgi:hypothetical protein
MTKTRTTKPCSLKACTYTPPALNTGGETQYDTDTQFFFWLYFHTDIDNQTYTQGLLPNPNGPLDPKVNLFYRDLTCIRDQIQNLPDPGTGNPPNPTSTDTSSPLTPWMVWNNGYKGQITLTPIKPYILNIINQAINNTTNTEPTSEPDIYLKAKKAIHEIVGCLMLIDKNIPNNSSGSEVSYELNLFLKLFGGWIGATFPNAAKNTPSLTQPSTNIKSS